MVAFRSAKTRKYAVYYEEKKTTTDFQSARKPTYMPLKAKRPRQIKLSQEPTNLGLLVKS